MAETFASRRKNVVASIRRLRQTYRKADSSGEILERELDRLIDRKTIISPENLQRTIILYEAYFRAVDALDTLFTDALRIAQSYV